MTVLALRLCLSLFMLVVVLFFCVSCRLFIFGLDFDIIASRIDAIARFGLDSPLTKYVIIDLRAAAVGMAICVLRLHLFSRGRPYYLVLLGTDHAISKIVSGMTQSKSRRGAYWTVP